MDRLWNRTNRESGCWIWTGCKNADGYGTISVNGKMHMAHRLSWELTNGPIPNGLFVCHKCDNPSCINPEHLFLGTNKDNMQDKVKKGRKNGGGPARGERNGSAKITKADVLEIRKLHANGISGRKIADKFGISDSQVFRIILNQCWK